MNFCEFIQLVVEGEAKLEEIRLQLANMEMFEPFTVFKRLDQPRTSALRIEQLQEFLEDNTVEYNVEEINYIFKVLDSDSDSIITYEDFKKNILPKTNDQVRDSALGHKSFDMPVGMLLPKEVETGLTNFLKQLQQNYNQFLNIKDPIALNELDIYDKDGSISVESLQIWLQAIGQEIQDEILENFVILIDRNPQNLQNLLDQIYLQPEYEEQEQQQNLEQSQEQKPDQKQIEVQDNNYQQNDIQQSDAMQESFNPLKTQQQQQQSKQQQPQKSQQEQKPEQKDENNNNKQEEQIVQSKILNDGQKQRDSPLLNYYNQQIKDEEAKIKQLCETLNIQDIYTTQRQESQIIKYYEKEIIREQEKLNKLLAEQQPENSIIAKSSFTPQPLYLDDYQYLREKSLLESQIRREEINLGLISSKIYSQPLTNSYLRYDSPSRIQDSYNQSSLLNSKKPFNQF